jgi:pimeloyl-ACP methyl ester carboxylesterase
MSNVLQPCKKSRCKSNDPSGMAKIYICKCRYISTFTKGCGFPAVILVTGLGERADNWMITNDPDEISVFEGVSKFTKVLAYDRPSRSSSIKNLATIKDSAKDLNLLLINSGIEPPYILVGHSLGGPIIRLYGSKYPENVAGFVFVDALSEDLADNLTKKELSNFEKLNDPLAQGRPKGSENTFYTTAVIPLLKCIKTPKVPTIILTADIPPITEEDIISGKLPSFVTQKFADDLWEAQLIAQDKFAKKFPCAKHITRTNSTHYIHVYQPKLVICSIKKVYNAYLEGKKCIKK